MQHVIIFSMLVGSFAASLHRPFSEALERAAMFALLGTIGLLLASCARAPDGSTRLDAGTTATALICGNTGHCPKQESRR